MEGLCAGQNERARVGGGTEREEVYEGRARKSWDGGSAALAKKMKKLIAETNFAFASSCTNRSSPNLSLSQPVEVLAILLSTMQMA